MNKTLLSFFLTMAAITCFSCSSDDCNPQLKEDCICTKEYQPVCGCDNITYGNTCEAACSNISDYTEGECPK